MGYDLSEISAVNVMQEIGVKREGLDVLAGGLPCQEFSKNVPRRNRYLEDPKNQLVAAFLRFAEAAMPRFILMENVAEMKGGFDGAYTNLLQESLKSKHLGYTVTHRVLHAPDFGVPQRRRCTFFLASRDAEQVNLPKPTHGKPSSAPNLFALGSHVTVWDALGDLPPLEYSEGVSPCDYESGAQNEF